jgi:four helix bundle protein
MENQKQRFKIQDSKAYQLANEVGEIVWIEVKKWPWLEQKAIGSQWTDSTDSISANLVEGFGRFHKRDRVKFYYNARASTLESIEWTKKAQRRKLISDEVATQILALLEKLPYEINFQIKCTMQKLKK